MSIEPGVLYVVATPIGNLKDISSRALEILTEVEEILAEDTRHSPKLLGSFGIATRLTALHAHNERRRTPQIIRRLRDRASLALISDAGTPLISDPGLHLVRSARENGVEVIPIPGPCALTTALSVSAINASRFVFEGFLPSASGARRTRLAELSKETRTLVFYEAPHRIEGLLADMGEIFGTERVATLARELTKSFETILTGQVSTLAETLASDENQRKGEFVVVVEGGHESTDDRDDLDKVLRVLLQGLSVRQAVSIAIKLTGVKRNEVYRRANYIAENG